MKRLRQTIVAGASKSSRLATPSHQSFQACQRDIGHHRLFHTSLMAMSGAQGGGAKLWGGRFTGATDPLMEQFNNSIGFDKRMWKADITGSIAYAKALGRTGLLSAAEVDSIVTGLGKVR